jgi:hypothetical protein
MTPEQFNELYGVGTSVNYHSIIGRPEHVKTRTRTEAYWLLNDQAVIMLEGKAGCVSLDAISVDPAIAKYAELGLKIMEHPGDCACQDCKEFLKQGDVVHEMGLQA